MTDARETKALTSLLHRQWWDVFETAKGRLRTLRDLDDLKNKAAIRLYVAKYLPELRRLKQKGKSNGLV
jgi:hypothetical protein